MPLDSIGPLKTICIGNWMLPSGKTTARKCRMQQEISRQLQKWRSPFWRMIKSQKEAWISKGWKQDGMKNTCQHFYRTAHFNASALFPGVQYCFRCTCKAAWDAHVVLSHMHMSYCFTCTSKTMLHTGASYVTLREGALSIPEKEKDGNDKHH